MLRAIGFQLLLTAVILAQSSPPQSKDWVLWACLPDRGWGGCVPLTSPLGRTACLIEMDAHTKDAAKGTRFACASADHVETKKVR